MSNSIFGQVMGVRKFVNGDIELDFYHEDEITEYRYSSDPSRLGNFPKELAETLASTLASDICVEIYFGEDGNPSYVELEECDDEDDLEDEDESETA
ncbi:hypothetical protein [Nitrosopumilus ureiphilus]|uniref:Uncharacterized protein n=1 Tax=Nitrosopumilus ureiphilus TaxID=1470067 RepID=A0A7D5R8A5_9ARCH|nr:hypothetical protein [Nitrosopumilus ureiphilus]QLH07658.1 hypothetical protein C5F50_11700 [Nitrosopumilus ureiphilus]